MAEIFQFRDTEAFNPLFEKAGYQSTTYMVEIGMILFVVIGFIVFVPVIELTKFALRKSTISNKVVNYIRKQTESIVYRVIIVRFLLEGIIELGLTAMISIIVFFKSFNSPKYENHTSGSRLLLIADRWTSGEIVSNTLAIMSMVGILASPLYLYYQSKKLFRH